MDTNPVVSAQTAADLREDLRKIGGSVCVYIPFCLLIASIFSGLWSKNGASDLAESNLYRVYFLTLSVVPILACIFLLMRSFGHRPSVFFLRPTVSRGDFVLYTLAGLIAMPAGSAVSLLTYLAFGWLNLPLPETPAVSGSLGTAIFFLANAFFAPLFEEILFRGLILERLRRYGDIYAVLISSALFALMHASLYSYAFAFVSGLFFGAVSVKTGSCLSSILLHFVNNFLSCIGVILTARGAAKEFNLTVYLIFAAVIIAFTATLLILGKRCKNPFTPERKCSCLKASRRASLFFSSFTVLVFIFFSLSIALSALKA